jgi:hypothetical protein
VSKVSEFFVCDEPIKEAHCQKRKKNKLQLEGTSQLLNMSKRKKRKKK